MIRRVLTGCEAGLAARVPERRGAREQPRCHGEPAAERGEHDRDADRDRDQITAAQLDQALQRERTVRVRARPRDHQRITGSSRRVGTCATRAAGEHEHRGAHGGAREGLDQKRRRLPTAGSARRRTSDDGALDSTDCGVRGSNAPRSTSKNQTRTSRPTVSCVSA